MGLEILAAPPGASKAEFEALASKGITPRDPRIANKIPVASAGYADSNAGWNELLILASETGADIALPVGSSYKFEKPFRIGAEVGFVVAGSEETAAFHFPTNAGKPVYAALKAKALVGATKLELKEVKGTFKAATPEAPQEVFINNFRGGVPNRRGFVSYTGIEGSGENITLTGVSGVTLEINAVERAVIQGCAIYAESGNTITSTCLEKGIEVVGPTTISYGTTYSKETPPEVMDGVWLGAGRRINCEVKNFRHPLVFTRDHQRIGSAFRTSGCWSTHAWMSPRTSAGNQVFEPGCYLNGGAWCSAYIDQGQAPNYVTYGDQCLLGQCPWPIWGAGGEINFVGLMMRSPIFEDIGLGIVGCPDGGLKLIEPEFTGNPGGAQNADRVPSGLTPVALFACSLEKAEVPNNNTFKQCWNSEMQAAFLGDIVKLTRIRELMPVIEACRSAGKPLVKGVTAEHPTVSILFKQGRVFGQQNADASIAEGHACEFRESGTSKLHRSEKNIGFAGVAVLAASQHVVPLMTNNFEPATVKVKEQNNPPTSPIAEANATAGTLENRAYFAKIVHELSGGGLTAASAEVSATPEANKSIKFKWTNATSLPHGQTIKATRVYIGTATGAEAGYINLVGTGTELLWSGAAKTGSSAPPTKNEGCEVYGENLVRCYGSEAPGCVCVSSGPADSAGIPIGQTFNERDNGSTAQVMLLAQAS